MESAVKPESIVLITRRTALEELITRFNTHSQTKFYIEQTARQCAGTSAPSFEEYQSAHTAYHRALDELRAAIPRSVKFQMIEREFLPAFQFSEKALVITIGPDGLVVNTAKYLTCQPILALNPDLSRIDGVLLPFNMWDIPAWLESALEGKAATREVVMAKAELNNGQALYAVNDLFIGARSHVSARYRLEFEGRFENHSSSGIIVSTGAGATGWLTSIIIGSCRIASAVENKSISGEGVKNFYHDWSKRCLYFAVREPFPSRISAVDLAFGRISDDSRLVLTSQMPENGVIFSDGIEADFMQFNAGAVATIGVAERCAHLLTKQPAIIAP